MSHLPSEHVYGLRAAMVQANAATLSVSAVSIHHRPTPSEGATHTQVRTNAQGRLQDEEGLPVEKGSAREPGRVRAAPRRRVKMFAYENAFGFRACVHKPDDFNGGNRYSGE